MTCKLLLWEARWCKEEVREANEKEGEKDGRV